MTAEEIIKHLSLEPHPAEGGYFRESYRSIHHSNFEDFDSRYEGMRSINTAIYYLLTPDSCSRIHKLVGDEIFHFYLGDPVEMINLHSDGTSRLIELGQDILGGQALQHLVPGDVWQGARLKEGGSFALLGTTVSPGFDFKDFQLAEGRTLSERYPEWAEMIETLS